MEAVADFGWWRWRREPPFDESQPNRRPPHDPGVRALWVTKVGVSGSSFKVAGVWALWVTGVGTSWVNRVLALGSLQFMLWVFWFGSLCCFFDEFLYLRKAFVLIDDCCLRLIFKIWKCLIFSFSTLEQPIPKEDESKGSSEVFFFFVLFNKP